MKYFIMNLVIVVNLLYCYLCIVYEIMIIGSKQIYKSIQPICIKWVEMSRV